jgi:hypothetical protein
MISQHCQKTPGGLLALRPGSQDAITYSKSKYENSAKIKLLLLKDHSYLDQYVIRFQKHLQNDTVPISRDIPIGMVDETPDQREYFAFHDAATGQWIGSFTGPDQLATHLAGEKCSRAWKNFGVIRNGVDVCSLQEFRHNWAKENGRLTKNAGSSDRDEGSFARSEEGQVEG